jgi:hypothetical protein
MPKHAKDTTSVVLNCVDDGQRTLVTLPKVWMDQLENSKSRFYLEGKLTKDKLQLEIKKGLIWDSGTYSCPECGDVDVFEGHLPFHTSVYDLGDELPVSCMNCGAETTKLKDWSA